MSKTKVFDLTSENNDIIDLTISNNWKGIKFTYINTKSKTNTKTQKITKFKHVTKYNINKTNKQRTKVCKKTNNKNKTLLSKYKNYVKINSTSKKALYGIIQKYNTRTQTGEIVNIKTRQMLQFQAQDLWDYAFLLPKLKTPTVRYEIKLNKTSFCKAYKIQFIRS